jgi:hypothetical protein
MTRLRLAALDLAGTSLAEALLRARMGLQLGHLSSHLDCGLATIQFSPTSDRDFPAQMGFIQYTPTLDRR